MVRADGLGVALSKVTRRILRRLRRRKSPNENAVICWALRNLQAHSLMVDVGAHRGGSLEPFLARGWRILAFEPDAENRERIQLAFGGVERLTVDARAVSNRSAQAVEFYKSQESSGISSLTPFTQRHVKVGEVDVVTLSQALEEHKIQKIDYLKVDAEGHDLFVLQGLDWTRWRPNVVLCEFEDSKTLELGYGFRDLAEFLLRWDYQVLVSEWRPIRHYGDDHRWYTLKRYPAALETAQAWGNLIAVQDLALATQIKHAFRRYRG